jgi:hypothetical protein
MLRGFVLSLVALGVVIASPAPAATQTAITALPDCQGALHVRPTYVLFACGDGGVYATGVRWKNWGAPFAIATATIHANDCTPDCAQGHFHISPAYLAATGRQRCRNGTLAYERVTNVARTHGMPTTRSQLDWLTLTCG